MDTRYAKARLKEIHNTMSSMMKNTVFQDEATKHQRLLDELRETQYVIAELAEAVLHLAEDMESES